MRRSLVTPVRWLLAAVLLAAVVAPARADGGLVRASGRSGGFLFTVFTSPTPLRAGRVDVSVMVQEVATSEPVLDARVDLQLAPAAGGGAAAVHARATRTQATNKLLYAAVPALHEEGQWTLRVRAVRGAQHGELSCTIPIGPRLPPVLSFWVWLALPPVAVLLFAVNRRLAADRRRLTSRLPGR